MVRLPDGHRALIRPLSQDDAIISEIFEQRPYEFHGKPKLGDVVIDAGAHIGLFTIKASTIVGSNGLVISVEPLPANYSMLLQNIKLNSLRNVIPIRAALGEEEDLIDLYFDKGQTVSSSICAAREKSVKVPLITIDRVVERFNINRVDFIKVDIEGAEYALLKGSRKTLERSKPLIVMEMHEYDGAREHVLGILKKFGYSVMEEKMKGIHYLYGECWKERGLL